MNMYETRISGTAHIGLLADGLRRLPSLVTEAFLHSISIRLRNSSGDPIYLISLGTQNAKRGQKGLLRKPGSADYAHMKPLITSHELLDKLFFPCDCRFSLPFDPPFFGVGANPKEFAHAGLN